MLMTRLKSLINEITNLGISKELFGKKKKRVRITNILSALIVVLVVPLYFLLNYVGATFLKSLIPAVVIYQMSILLLNKKGYINLSRFIAPNVNSLIIFIYSTSLGPETLYFFFYFPAISGSFLYFELKEKLFFIVQIVFTSSLVILDLFFKVRPFPVLHLSHQNTLITGYAMSLAAFILFLICLFVLAAESQAAETSLIKAKSEAEAATIAKSNFLARMSHEIRTPMNAIIGLTHLTLKTKLSVKQQDYIKKIKKASQTLLRIINEILDFSKIEARKMQVENVKFNLMLIIEDIENIVGVKANEKGVKLIVNIDKEIPVFLKGDPLRIAQVLVNLADNAIKFTESGIVEISVIIVEKTTSKVHVLFSVKDEGIGMSPLQISNMFESFYQADESITRHYGGTGLGLTISKQLVELMDGKLEVESSLGKGTNFFFNISLDVYKDTDEIQKASVPEKMISEGRILIVEDNVLNQQVISELIEQIGFDYDIAVNGKQGYLMACKNTYDLALMDIQMPEMDGITATENIRKCGITDLPIIAMSAHSLESDIEKSLKAGMNAYIVKPIDPDKLYNLLNKFIKSVKKNDIQKNKKKSKIDKHGILPKIEGIETEIALKRVGDSEELYLKLLKEYSMIYKDVNDEISSYIDKNKMGKAKNLVHALKGASGMLGMINANIIYSNIEQALINEDLKSVRELMASNKNDLEKLIENIEAFFSMNDLSIVENNNANDEEKRDYSTLSELIQKLINLCNQSNSDAMDIAYKLKSKLNGTKYNETISQIVLLVEDVEFKEASKLSVKLLDKIGD